MIYVVDFDTELDGEFTAKVEASNEDEARAKVLDEYEVNGGLIIVAFLGEPVAL